jgi:DNA-binding NarL/FixJ family response regulator
VQKITVLLAEQQRIIREGVRALLRSQEDLEVVAEASNGFEAVEAAQTLSPAVVLTDLALPKLNGFEVIRRIRRTLPGTRFLVLTSHDDQDCLYQMLFAGATGFLSKRSAANQLAEAIRAVYRGKTFFSPELLKFLRDKDVSAMSAGRAPQKEFQLTPRETEVLRFIAEGLTTKAIGRQLGISFKTVEKHRQTLMEKLNIHEIAGLTIHAIRKRLVPNTGPRPRPAPVIAAVAGSAPNPETALQNHLAG